MAENLLLICKEAPVSERMSDNRSFEVLTASPVRLSSSPARSYALTNYHYRAVVDLQPCLATSRAK